MSPQDFKYFVNEIRSKFSGILENCYTDFIEVDINSADGQVFTLEAFYGEELIYYNDGKIEEINNYDVVRPILHFQAKGPWSNVDLNINTFFRVNNEIYDEFDRLASNGYLDTLVPIIKQGKELISTRNVGQTEDDAYLFLSINSRVCKGSQFVRDLLDENITTLELYSDKENTIIASCLLCERKRILAIVDGYPTNLIIPFDKIDIFKSFEKESEILNVDENYIFVAMSFQADPLLEDSYETIKRSAKRVRKSINCERVDDILGDFVITNKILECIKRSKVMIVDLTGNRPNVYYELGYARALGKPIVLLARDGERPHFDVSSQNIIFYRNQTDLERGLSARLRALYSKKT